MSCILPWLLFALPAGALIDRIDRRKAMIAPTTTARATLVTPGRRRRIDQPHQ
jgi:hypothetical protein